ncbi:MAG: hypothetical protein ACRC5C_12745, partial [Bacilli bacterium]
MKKEIVQQHLERACARLVAHRRIDGAFIFPFEGSLLTECGTLILLHVLGEKDIAFERRIVARIQRTRNINGTWRVYPDETDNYSETLLAWFTLVVTGHIQHNDPNYANTVRYLQQ